MWVWKPLTSVIMLWPLLLVERTGVHVHVSLSLSLVVLCLRVTFCFSDTTSIKCIWNNESGILLDE
jgi:hypothetical protein